jgi:hypothetical protein
MRRVATTTLLLLAAGMAAGCRTGLPRTPSAGPEDALDRIAQRVEGIRSLSARAVLTVRSAEGETIRLRVALAAEGPERMRLRAWKLGHAALDVTIREERVWLWVAEEPAEERAEEGGAATGGEGGDVEVEEELFSRIFRNRRLVWHVLRGGLPDHAEGRIDERSDARRFHVSVPMRGDEGATLRVTVDRPTLTVRAYEMVDGTGDASRQVRVSSHRLVSGTPLPAEIHAEGERGTITLELERTTVNPELAPETFEPPGRAEMLRGLSASRPSDR